MEGGGEEGGGEGRGGETQLEQLPIQPPKLYQLVIVGVGTCMCSRDLMTSKILIILKHRSLR